MTSSITIAGIDLAISQLNYRNTQAPKYKCIQAIRRFYNRPDAVENLRHIDSDILIKTIWDIGDDMEIIKSKRKNFNSIRSTVNADLKRLYQEGKNKEGITISSANVFEMSESAKNQLLSSFADVIHSGEGSTLKKISEVLSLLNNILPDLDKKPEKESQDELKKIFDLVKSLSNKVIDSKYIPDYESGTDGIDKSESNYSSETEKREKHTIKSNKVPPLDIDQIEESEIEEVQDLIDDLETVYEDQIQEVYEEDMTTIEIDQTAETELAEVEETIDSLEIVDEDQIQEVDEEDFETIETDQTEETAETELAEVEDAVDDLETVDEEQIQEIDDEDLETIETDQTEETAETELAEVEDTIDNLETVDEDQIQEIEDEDLETHEDDQTEETAETELAEVEDAVDDLETVDEEQIQEADEEDLETVEGDQIEEAEIQEVQDVIDDLETVDEDQIQEVDEGQIQEPVGLPLDNTDTIKKPDPNLLSEQFDGALGAMERYYNQYIQVPAGKYIVGRAAALQNELPLQDVHLPALYMGKFPVTNALFEVFIEKTGYQTTAEKRGWSMVYYGRFCKIKDPKSGRMTSRWNASLKKIKTQGAFWYQPGGPGTTLHRKRNHPVVQVSFADAMAFAAWTGKRLPAEIEWEAVMRTAKGYLYPWGDEWQGHRCNHEKSAISDTTPVDQFSEGLNPLGFADAMGNIFEWTADETKPPFAKIRKTTYHIVRGGSWISGQETTLLTRSRFERDFTANILGFRCVAD